MSENKLYPTLPTAPPDGSFVRYNRVKDLRNGLEQEKKIRNDCYKKYSKVSSGLQKTILVLSTTGALEAGVGIATSLTVIGLPVGIILAGLGAASSITAAVLNPIANHCHKKKVKHAKMRSILTGGLNVLDEKTANYLNDGEIDDKEYDELVLAYEKIKKSLETSLNVDELRAEAKEELTNELFRRMPSQRKKS